MNWNKNFAKEMQAAEIPINKIARVFGLTGDTVKRKLDPSYAKQRQERINEKRRIRLGQERAALASGNRVTRRQDEAAERMALIPDDTRSLTGRMFGDPLPGRSALSKRPA